MILYRKCPYHPVSELSYCHFKENLIKGHYEKFLELQKFTPKQLKTKFIYDEYMQKKIEGLSYYKCLSFGCKTKELVTLWVDPIWRIDLVQNVIS